MNLGRVVGRVVSSHKDASLEGTKLLLVQPVDPQDSPRGSTLVAVDAVGAGAGELVIYVRGREAAHAFLPAHVLADAGVVGIVDEVSMDAAAGEPS
jgi:ethanolamine utilization protein EutN